MEISFPSSGGVDAVFRDFSLDTIEWLIKDWEEEDEEDNDEDDDDDEDILIGNCWR